MLCAGSSTCRAMQLLDSSALGLSQNGHNSRRIRNGGRENFPHSLAVLVPALFHAGRTEEAHHAFQKMMDYYPGLTIGKVSSALLFGADMVERIVGGLRQIGLPE
jgi:pentatricopeptide repeat protein